mmetsp:Transcript_74105/g.162174  ORF Transcript_74105/g.162174 Transcript_74105/m.162174 type:complete len:452 (-) Transcript_74105:24-1379(-)
MSMHTTAEWAHHAASNMIQAQDTQSRAHHQNGRSRSAHAGAINDNLMMYRELSHAMQRKVGNSHRIIEMLQKRADSLENSIHQTTASLSSLEKALRAKDAPLQLCNWRSEQREKRPLREQVRDPVELALEEEKATLMDTQRKLKEAMRRTKAAINDLRHGLHDCQADIEQKMQALSVDEMCLRSTESSMNRVLERTPPPTGSGPRSPNSIKQKRHQVALMESTRNEAERQRLAERGNRALAAREEAARALREENSRLERHCEQSANEAFSKSERRLQERVTENQNMRRRLESELRETQHRIMETKTTMSETKYQIKALEDPMDLTATCASLRKQRAAREGIVDPVSTTLQGHRMTILTAQQDLLLHHQNEKTNLQDLSQRREQLKEDLRDKTMALHIDLNCLTHEVVKLNGQSWTGINKSKASRASQADKTWVPGAVAVSSQKLTRPMSAR